MLGRAAAELGRRAVGQIGFVPLAGVDDRQPRRAAGGQEGGERLDRAAQLGHVVAEALAEAAGQQEVALHVDHQQRGAARVEGEGAGLGVDSGHAQASVAAITSSEVATQPKTPPCMVTMCSAAAWLPGSVAPVQSLRIRHS